MQVFLPAFGLFCYVWHARDFVSGAALGIVAVLFLAR
jgi:hypothetical protein